MKNLTKLLSFLFRSTGNLGFSRAQVYLVLAAGVFAGLVSTALLALVSHVLSLRPEAPEPIWGWGFVALCVALPLVRFGSQVTLVRLAQGVMFELRMRLSRMILSTPLRHLETVGPARLLASLTDDVNAITTTLVQVPAFCLHLTVVTGCLGYMAILSPQLFLIVLGFVVIGIATYQIPLFRAQRHYRSAREAWDEVVAYFRGVVEGTKELKVHRPRREALLDTRLRPTADRLRSHNVRGGAIYAVVNSWGQVLFFALIGLVLFVLPAYVAMDERIATGYVVAILYMLTPLDVILHTFPTLARAAVSVEKVEELGLSLSAAPSDAGTEPLAPEGAPWRLLELVDVHHSYWREDADDVFTLGPIDLRFEPGELVFFIGGNGSGKTTLAKLILGLYPPESGELRLDGVEVTDRNRDTFRQRFSVVFSDFFLFESLLGLEADELDESARRYLRELHLDGKVTVTDGELSTTALSQGQRKRLALLTAYLEDRDIYLFDEWAADQDPIFKEIFYRELVPALRERGKTVLIVSHDDAYYEVADRIVKLGDGRVQFDGPATRFLAGDDGRRARDAAPAGTAHAEGRTLV